MTDIISKIKKSGLTGRGGAGFPVARKWEMVKNAKGGKKFVVGNASEGEPGIKKDGFILENYPDKVIDGLQIALDYLPAVAGYLYLNPDYFKTMAGRLEAAIGFKKIEIIGKPHSAGYIGGEETSVLNGIEGERIEPRLKPPFPVTNGLWGCPTLVNNVETFYAVSLIAAGRYEKKRFYTISGDCLWTGVHELPEDWSLEKVLKETKNYPDFKFFVQVGGNASGEVLNKNQLDKPAGGGGSITVYSLAKHQPAALIKQWIDFYQRQSCGQCTPCREGTYRLQEMINGKNIDWQRFHDLLDNLKCSSFCALGASLPVPIYSFINNVLPMYAKTHTFLAI